MAKTIPKFNDEVIQKLFGHEAAEDEDKARPKTSEFSNRSG
jgi:hypothetical protein